MSKLTIQLLILTTLVVGWTIFMLYQWSRHKKRMKEIEVEWEVRRRRWQLDSLCNDRIRRSAMVPDEGYMPSAMFKTDKLSPQKKVVKHTMR